MKIPKIETDKGDHLEIRMTLTGNQSITGMPPRYEINHMQENGSYIPLMRLAVQERKIGYTVDSYSYIDTDPRQVIGFAFTAKGADKMAHRKTLKAAQKISYEHPSLPIEDKSYQDVSALLQSHREIAGIPHPTDMNGKSLEAKFARRTQ